MTRADALDGTRLVFLSTKAGRTPRRMDRANAQALAGDALKIIPSCVWCIVCLVAILSYASIDWHGAVFTAIFSMCLCILAARDAIYLSPTMKPLAAPFGYRLALDDEEMLSALQNERKALTKLRFAAAFLFTSAFLTVFFLATFYAVIAPAAGGTSAGNRSKMPCDGECEGCIEDPDCHEWSEALLRKHPVVGICPPPRRSADTDVTFSCSADGYWMLVTTFIAAVWLALVTRQLRTAAVRVALSAVNSIGTEMQAGV